MAGHPPTTARPEALDRAAAGVAASGVTYMAVCAASQLAQLSLLGVHTGHRVMPTLLGVTTVAVASAASVLVGDVVAGVSRRHASPTAALVGVACFIGLGGRFWRLSPSGLAHLGALSDTARGSLPATVAYATRAEREAIQALGRRFGCHSCGARPLSILRPAPFAFVADHQPPLASVRVANAAAWRRLLGRTVSQRFYPQCTSCSGKQAALLSERASLAKTLGSARKAFFDASHRGTQSVAVLHWPSPLRPHYAVGAVLEALSHAAPASRAKADAALCSHVRRRTSEFFSGS